MHNAVAPLEALEPRRLMAAHAGIPAAPQPDAGPPSGFVEQATDDRPAAGTSDDAAAAAPSSPGDSARGRASGDGDAALFGVVGGGPISDAARRLIVRVPLGGIVEGPGTIVPAYPPVVSDGRPFRPVGPRLPAVTDRLPLGDRPFTVFDEMAVDPTGSDPEAVGLEPIYVTYNNLYPVDDQGRVDDMRVDEQKVRKHARAAADAGLPWVVDIEHWPGDVRFHDPADVRETIDKFVQLVAWAKDEAPDVQVGFYGVLPIRDYWTPTNLSRAIAKYDPDRPHTAPGLERAISAHEAWRAANDFLRPLAEAVDFIAPSLYTFYEDVEGWEQYATANLAEAARYGKPIVPFLMPHYHPSNTELEGAQIDGAFWRRQLDLVHEFAAGVTVWRYLGEVPGDEPWWLETVDFVAGLDSGGEDDGGKDEPGPADGGARAAFFGSHPNSSPALDGAGLFADDGGGATGEGDESGAGTAGLI